MKNKKKLFDSAVNSGVGCWMRRSYSMPSILRTNMLTLLSPCRIEICLLRISTSISVTSDRGKGFRIKNFNIAPSGRFGPPKFRKSQDSKPALIGYINRVKLVCEKIAQEARNLSISAISKTADAVCVQGTMKPE